MYFYDTNILLSNLEFVKENGKFIISPVTIEELESIKTSANKDAEVKYQARQAVKYLTDNEDLWTATRTNYSKNFYCELKDYHLPETNDGKIILDFIYELSVKQFMQEEKVIFVTNDLLCNLFAKQAIDEAVYLEDEYKGNNVLMLKTSTEEKIYSGYKEVSLTNDEYNELWNEYELGNNPYSLIENEYLIIHDENKKTIEYCYKQGRLVPLKLPKGIKALNPKQRCVLDLLENEDVPIKVICGVYGTGKTYLSVNVTINKMTKSTKSNIATMFLVRQPFGEGDDIGYLKGTKEEKIRDFFNPIYDNVEGGQFTLDPLIQKGMVDCDVPYFMKGRSLNSTMVLVDEAEDLTLKQIKLLGSRLGKDSQIVFMGDWKQASGKYQYDCGLTQFIDYVYNHPNPLVGIMVMDEDVRSDSSKYFADII